MGVWGVCVSERGVGWVCLGWVGAGVCLGWEGRVGVSGMDVWGGCVWGVRQGLDGKLLSKI